MSAIYESSRLLAEYLLFHYGRSDEVLPSGRDWPAGMTDALGFPVRTVGHFGTRVVDRGLDLGCAVGRSTFEMARTCRQVVGVDFSSRFIQVAQRLATGAALDYQRLEEGTVGTPLSAAAPEGVDLRRVEFREGDAMALPQTLGPFDRVHAANLLCRLPEPVRLLARLPALVRPGGELVLATPCTWLEDFTPPENWPQGATLEWLKHHLSADFTLRATVEEPFLIRETARKFQWSSSLVTVWTKCRR